MSIQRGMERSVARRFSVVVEEGRRARGLTQEQLAERLGVSQATIHNWERQGGPSFMAPARLRKLASLIGAEPVEVAESLGYPVRDGRVRSGRAAAPAADGASARLSPDEQDELVTAVAELLDLVAQQTEQMREGVDRWGEQFLRRRGVRPTG